MKTRLVLSLLIGAITLLFAFGAVACGDDDEEGTPSQTAGAATLEDYLKDVNDIQDGVSAATDDIGDRAQFAFTDPAKARQSLSAASSVGESAITALQKLTPPATAKTAHDNLIKAGQNLVAAVQDAESELTGVQAGPAFEAFKTKWQADDSTLTKALSGMKDACTAMQDLAKTNKVDIAIACPTQIT